MSVMGVGCEMALVLVHPLSEYRVMVPPCAGVVTVSVGVVSVLGEVLGLVRVMSVGASGMRTLLGGARVAGDAGGEDCWV